MTGSDVQRLDPARRALSEAEELPDIAKLVDYAEAAKQAAKRAGLAEESQRAWAIFSLEAQRKAGELLRQAPKATGSRGLGRASGSRGLGADSASAPKSPPPLREVLETETDDQAQQKAHRWQQVADVPQETFDEYVETAEEPSRAGLIRRLDDVRRQAERDAEVQAQERADEERFWDGVAEQAIESGAADRIAAERPYGMAVVAASHAAEQILALGDPVEIGANVPPTNRHRLDLIAQAHAWLGRMLAAAKNTENVA